MLCPVLSLTPSRRGSGPQGFRHLGVSWRDYRASKNILNPGGISAFKKPGGVREVEQWTEPTQSDPRHESLGCGKSMFPLEEVKAESMIMLFAFLLRNPALT